MRALDPELLVYDVATLEHVFHYGGSELFLLRMVATFAGAFGALGLVLAMAQGRNSEEFQGGRCQL